MRVARTVRRSIASGWLALVAIHISSAWTGVGLGFGWLTCGVATILGLPGTVLLLLLHLID